MCEEIKILRISFFFFAVVIISIAIFSGWRFCKKNNINFNSVDGMFEMYGYVFSFKDKAFSILMLLCIYGGALLGLVVIGISFWAESKGCTFPKKYN
ncbi:hypothetical protein [Rahnella sikkimica]|uniref:Uncharacterized protein n=1 Tax=Rahnella sikkimica TaxID=1805933 RepID=A0A2L1UVZ6_9GAMM|nr:hypothetical protein [Rahnella sikkimica]AVF37071.1 hypothetical protein BV494_20115 [Rahnella sikkimica]